MIVMVGAPDALNAFDDDAVKYFDLGVELQKKEDLDGAIAQFHTAIRLNPNLAVAPNNLGAALGRKEILTRQSRSIAPPFA